MANVSAGIFLFSCVSLQICSSVAPEGNIWKYLKEISLAAEKSSVNQPVANFVC